MKRNYFEWGMGCLVIVVFLVSVFVGALLCVRMFGMYRSYIVYADFASVEGVKLGDPVQVAGVRIGQVASVDLYKGHARLGLRMADQFATHEDATASIKSRALFTGDKLISIEPGNSRGLLKSGDLIAATYPAQNMTDLLLKFVTGNFVEE